MSRPPSGLRFQGPCCEKSSESFAAIDFVQIPGKCFLTSGGGESKSRRANAANVLRFCDPAMPKRSGWLYWHGLSRGPVLSSRSRHPSVRTGNPTGEGPGLHVVDPIKHHWLRLCAA